MWGQICVSERWGGEKEARKATCLFMRRISQSTTRTCADGADGALDVEFLERRAVRERVGANALHTARDRDAG